jgi:hypothetical protein
MIITFSDLQSNQIGIVKVCLNEQYGNLTVNSKVTLNGETLVEYYDVPNTRDLEIVLTAYFDKKFGKGNWKMFYTEENISPC